MSSGIYKIEDAKGRLYIGSSNNIESRIGSHTRRLAANKHENIKLQRAWNKYGASYFTFSVVEIVNDVSQLFIEEQKYLDLLFNNYSAAMRYNILRVAGSPVGIKRSAETKTKISAASKGNNGNAKMYTLLSPNGTVVEIYNMRKFCRDNNYSFGNMCEVANGKRKSAYGWRSACQQQ